MNRNQFKHRLAAVVLLAIVCVLSGPALAQVMQQVPPEALVVLKINNIKGTSDKLAKLAQDMGVAQMLPQAADPLAALQAQAKMQQGMNTAGEMAIVYLDPSKNGGDPQQSILLLVPVSDYKAFIGNWPGAQTTGEITEAKLDANAANTAFISNWGSYAAVSPNKTIVSKKPAGGIHVPSVTAREMTNKDIILYTNFVGLRPQIQPLLQQGRAMLVQQLDNSIRTQPEMAKMGPLIKAIGNKVLDMAEEFVNDTEATSMGISLAPEGITTTLMAEFTPNTYITQNITSMKNTGEPLLAGLPQGKYLFYGGAALDSKMMTKLIGDAADPIVKEMLAIGPEMAPAKDYVDAMKVFMGATKQQASGMLAPTGAVGTGALMQMVNVATGDTKAMVGAYQKLIDSQQALMKSFNVPGMEAMKLTNAANVKTVDGVQFNSMSMPVDANQQNAAAAQQAQMMRLMYGPQGFNFLYGVIGDKMLGVTGVDDKVISDAIAAVKANKSVLAQTDAVKPVDAQLPKERLGVAYISLGEIATTGLNYAKQFGFAMPVQMPPDLPPVGMTLSTEAGTALRVDVYVPTTLVQSLVAAGMQAAMQMQAPPANPGGGL